MKSWFSKTPKQRDTVVEKTIFDEAQEWEVSRQLQLERSEHRAWLITGGSSLLTLLSWLALIIILPLKETIPYLIRVDNTTGHTDIITSLKEKTLPVNEVTDKYWIANYLRARETYDWHTLQKDYDTVGLLSSQKVGVDYAKLFEGDKALDKQWGNQFRATIEIQSIVLHDKNIATVRFMKRIERTNQNSLADHQSWVATLNYEYHNPSLLKESQRLINPLGFQILSYRVDPELTGGAK
jgi:type IV secretory pathway component VirB8